MFVQHQVISIRQTPLFIMAILFFLFVFFAFDRPDLEKIKFNLASGGFIFFGIIYYILSKTKIIIDNTGITFQYFIRKSFSVAWQDIAESKLEWEFDIHSGNILWKLFFSNRKPHSFQSSFYSRKNLRILAESMIIKCPNAILDKRIRKMAEGKFPSYIF